MIRGLQPQFSACAATLPFLLASLSESGLRRSWLLFSTDLLPDLAPGPVHVQICRSCLREHILSARLCREHVGLVAPGCLLPKMRSVGGTGLPVEERPLWRAALQPPVSSGREQELPPKGAEDAAGSRCASSPPFF